MLKDGSQFGNCSGKRTRILATEKAKMLFTKALSADNSDSAIQTVAGLELCGTRLDLRWWRVGRPGPLGTSSLIANRFGEPFPGALFVNISAHSSSGSLPLTGRMAAGWRRLRFANSSPLVGATPVLLIQFETLNWPSRANGSGHGRNSRCFFSRAMRSAFGWATSANHRLRFSLRNSV